MRARAAIGLSVWAACGGSPPEPSLAGYLDDLAHRGELTGTVRVERGGDVLIDAAYGLADEAEQLPNATTTQFRIGSNTKQFTAMAVLLLADAGKLATGDPICTYLAGCPAAWQGITIQHLLEHSSGIPDYINAPDFPMFIGTPATVDELIARFRDLPLLFAPGSQWSYSNSGYLLLGAIVTRVSGQSYAQFLADHIFTPLGMTDTRYDVDTPALPGHATGYLSPGVEPVFIAMSELDAAGALASTTADLARWDRALLAGELGSDAARAALFTPHIACPAGGCALPSDVGYGDGWFVAEPDGRRYIYHWGRIDGFRTSNGFYPDEDLTVIVLSNLETVDTFGIASELGARARR